MNNITKIRSEAHRKFVASQPCMITGKEGDNIAPHHLLRVGGKGMGTKVCDRWCVPLYFEIHDQLHKNGNEIAFFENHGWNYEFVKNEATNLALISPDKKIREAAERGRYE